MQVKQINDKLSVAHQIEVSDVKAIKAAGFTVMICNRPDHEEASQPMWADIQASAEAEGLQTAFLPMSNRQDALSVVDEFRQIIQDATGPVFAYCRTGTRCEILWMMTQS